MADQRQRSGLCRSPEAQRGGTLHLALDSFPLTFRVVGPDSNTSFRGAILGNQLGLTGIHPNTLNIIPELATHWAYGSDKKTMYFKLDPAGPLVRRRAGHGRRFCLYPGFHAFPFHRGALVQRLLHQGDRPGDRLRRPHPGGGQHQGPAGSSPENKHRPDAPTLLRPPGRGFHPQDQLVRGAQYRPLPDRPFQKGALRALCAERTGGPTDRRYFKNRFNVDTVLYQGDPGPQPSVGVFQKGKLDVYPATIPQVLAYQDPHPGGGKGIRSQNVVFQRHPPVGHGPVDEPGSGHFQGRQPALCLRPCHERKEGDHPGAAQRLFPSGERLRGLWPLYQYDIKARRYDLARWKPT
jgi:hypothetical protein